MAPTSTVKPARDNNETNALAIIIVCCCFVVFAVLWGLLWSSIYKQQGNFGRGVMLGALIA